MPQTDKKPITQGFIAAAGYGKRLRPLTNTLPKPLVTVAGKALLDYAIENLAEAQVTKIALNTHYLPDKIENHLTRHNFSGQIAISYEQQLMDTGGGIKKALPLLEEAPFYMLSGDSLLCNGLEDPALKRMADYWDEEQMDILLLLQPCSAMTVTDGIGDYDLDGNGQAVRAPDKSGSYMWTSARICHPRIFENTPDTAFSFLELLDKAQEKGRLFGLIHDGDWHHITVPADIDHVTAALTNAATKKQA